MFSLRSYNTTFSTNYSRDRYYESSIQQASMMAPVMTLWKTGQAFYAYANDNPRKAAAIVGGYFAAALFQVAFGGIASIVGFCTLL